MLLAPTDGRSDDGHVLVFYDPDANQQAILKIRQLFNEFLRQEGLAIQFQPVASRDQLDALIRTGRVEFAIVSSSYLRDAGKELRPLLVPEVRGETHYRKLLVEKGPAEAGRTDMSKKSIAATLTDASDKGAAVLHELRRAGIATDGAIVIPVSKDIDALLALSFGQVQAALVTASSIEVLRRINPVGAQGLRTLLETGRILRPPFCAVSASDSQQKQIVAAFSRMQADEQGKRALTMLGFERWVPFAPSMMGAER